MRGRYLIGVDNGSQSTKVVIYDLVGNAVAEGRQALRPASRPRPGIVQHPDDDLWSSIIAASREALAAFAGDPQRNRRRRPLHDSLLQGFPASGRLAGGAGHELDGYARVSTLRSR